MAIPFIVNIMVMTIRAQHLLDVCEECEKSFEQGRGLPRKYLDGNRQEMFVCALLRLNSVTELKSWRQEDLDRFTCDGYLRRLDRFKLCVYLLGNGCAEEDIMVLMGHMLRDDSAVRGIESLLKGYHSRKKELWYYDTSTAVYKYLDGRLKQSGGDYRLFLWEEFAFIHRSWITLGMSEKFFSQCEVQCPYVFFGIEKV